VDPRYLYCGGVGFLLDVALDALAEQRWLRLALAILGMALGVVIIRDRYGQKPPRCSCHVHAVSELVPLDKSIT
jgi:hypothetical protein